MTNSWTDHYQLTYSTYAKNYISTFPREIDCADLALATLVSFAGENNLPLRLKYYSSQERKWNWFVFRPGKTNTSEFTKTLQINLGAVNLIDNTINITKHDIRAGDLMLTNEGGEGFTGHTMIVYGIEEREEEEDALCTFRRWVGLPCSDEIPKNTYVIWYQGNLPAVIPQRREGLLDEKLETLYAKSARRWNYRQFNG